ncbi:3-hydroxyacyl-CoA dehydrogenase [Thalassovita litoralis]|uniref:3-hydroxyacyl-CoA dehydrogenase n=1 Tax=Thalassovita litoralis TaxID=1010611 RepID=A0A521C5I3_9RHOB|nr:3-hydroxyacyl-CoA dehydrogenase NAD-binding domain-containing protein [Thalassovita litoralis]SMO54615.1 3-hydroxyacyl-CoA dehydrogenase [Thalassovita litoralis]
MTQAKLLREGDLGILRIDNPPVNALGEQLVGDLIDGFAQFEADTSLIGLVIECVGRTFVAGGDIAAFENPEFSAIPMNALLGRIEGCSRPVVAALHGTVLGGGLELAMACHVRVAHPQTIFGLPEILLGLIPGSLGTQRLPRLVGLELAYQMISTGKPISAAHALSAGLADALDDLPGVAARTMAHDCAGADLRRTSELTPPDIGNAGAVLDAARRASDKAPWLLTRRAVADCMAAAATLPFAEGEAAEARAFNGLVHSTQSRAQRRLFFAEREAQKIPGLSGDLRPRNIQRVGIVGVGTMGGGIAMCFANAGFPVTLVETTPEALERGRGLIAKAYAGSVKRGILSAEAAAEREGAMTGSTDMSALADCDIVVEAVFEDMKLKLDVAQKLGAICKPGAIIATNTSTLDVDQIAAATGRAADVIGTHFFSPAHIMKLLEVVRGAQTAPDTLLTVMKLAKRIAKTAVVSGVCYGFIGNRMAEVYGRENEAMLLEGASPAQIDGVAQSPDFIGLAMGPNRMLDMAGVDVGARTVIEWIASGEGPQEPNYRVVCQALFQRGQNGQKTGHGYYLYNDGKPVPSNATAALCAQLAAEHGVTRRDNIPDQEIFERLLFPMVNEAALILEEGIAYRAGDIDVVWTSGYGFPAWQGGPIFMADEIGLDRIVARMDHYAQVLGNPHGYWTPAPLLRKLAESGGRLSDWKRV